MTIIKSKDDEQPIFYEKFTKYFHDSVESSDVDSLMNLSPSDYAGIDNIDNLLTNTQNYVSSIRSKRDSFMQRITNVQTAYKETQAKMNKAVANDLPDSSTIGFSSTVSSASASSGSRVSSLTSSSSNTYVNNTNSFQGSSSNDYSNDEISIEEKTTVNNNNNSDSNSVNNIDIDVDSMILSSLAPFGVSKESIDGIRRIENYDEYDYIVLMKNQEPDGIWDPYDIKAYYVKDGKVVGMLTGNDIYTSVEDGKLVLDESRTAPTGIITASAVSATVVGNESTVIEKSDIINNDGKSENSIVGDELTKDRKETDVTNVNTDAKNNQGTEKSEGAKPTSSSENKTSSISSKESKTEKSSSPSNTKSLPKTSKVTPKNSNNTNNSSSSNNSSSVVNVLDGNVINTDKPIYNGTKYNYSDDDLAYLGYVAQEEQGSVEGAKLELSLMANLYEENKNHFSSVTDYVQNSGWFAYGSTSGYSYPGDSYVAAAREVLNEGKRYLAPNVVEHDYLGDLIYCSTGDIDDKSSYIPGQTVLENQWGARYVFVGFAPNGGDPFGYLIN